MVRCSAEGVVKLLVEVLRRPHQVFSTATRGIVRFRPLFNFGSVSTWEDLTIRFLAQLFPPGRTAKLHNDILMFQQHQEIGTQQPEEPERTIEDEIQDLHLNLPVLEVLAHATIYNAILDKYVESLELGNNGSAFIHGEMPKTIEDPGLFTLPCKLGDSKPFDTLDDLG
uniref:Zinc finger, CCHC-type n=1 Tax=Tanacetum cinerariifolium TaxID=118510 RepID=A0A6L2KKC1_TANCI|nr:zinc finger, CCHC-type [Tanacetum cinerariifolium]